MISLGGVGGRAPAMNTRTPFQPKKTPEDKAPASGKTGGGFVLKKRFIHRQQRQRLADQLSFVPRAESWGSVRSPSHEPYTARVQRFW